MKFVLPYRALGLGFNTAHNSYVLSFETDDLKNYVYEWGGSRVFREYALPDGRIGKTFVQGQNIVSLRDKGTYRKIEYFRLPE